MRNPALRSQASPPRSDRGATRHNAAGAAGSPKLGKSDRSGKGRRDADGDGPRGLRGERLTPQPLFKSRAGGPRAEGAEAKGPERGGAGGTGEAVKLHRGVVITDELRKELLNPLAHHRFKLLRGAH